MWYGVTARCGGATMRRFIAILLILNLITWLLILFLPEPKARVSAVMQPATFVADPAPVSLTPTAPAAHVVSKAKAHHKTGPCQNPDDRAADGSRCGNRAASVRPGGR